MSDVLQLIPVWLAGMLLGMLFFGGLWWTVQKGLASPRPATWFIGSLLLRTGITLSGFYWVAGEDWKRMAACLFGFICARLILTRLTAIPLNREASHAP